MKKEKLFFRLSNALSWVFVLWFLALSAHLLAQDIKNCLFFLLLSAVPFFLISALRRLIGAKRPYQNGKIFSPQHGKDNSFPSRHAYSCFFISTVSFSFFPIISPFLALGAILLSVFRALSRAHYPIDVIAGAVFGIVAGLITLLFI